MALELLFCPAPSNYCQSLGAADRLSRREPSDLRPDCLSALRGLFDRFPAGGAGWGGSSARSAGLVPMVGLSGQLGLACVRDPGTWDRRDLAESIPDPAWAGAHRGDGLWADGTSLGSPWPARSLAYQSAVSSRFQAVLFCCILRDSPSRRGLRSVLLQAEHLRLALTRMPCHLPACDLLQWAGANPIAYDPGYRGPYYGWFAASDRYLVLAKRVAATLRSNNR